MLVAVAVDPRPGPKSRPTVSPAPCPARDNNWSLSKPPNTLFRPRTDCLARPAPSTVVIRFCLPPSPLEDSALPCPCTAPAYTVARPNRAPFPPSNTRGPPDTDFRGATLSTPGPPETDFWGAPLSTPGPPETDFLGATLSTRGPPDTDFRGAPAMDLRALGDGGKVAASLSKNSARASTLAERCRTFWAKGAVGSGGGSAGLVSPPWSVAAAPGACNVAADHEAPGPFFAAHRSASSSLRIFPLFWGLQNFQICVNSSGQCNNACSKSHPSSRAAVQKVSTRTEHDLRASSNSNPWWPKKLPSRSISTESGVAFAVDRTVPRTKKYMHSAGAPSTMM
mmetsp:Transcript_95891/g.219781  ORF Transcript_95891/g.219781 Transcript_95891/m.219781 type:complete len:338 (-) Transcript_95891:513-1526(-)